MSTFTHFETRTKKMEFSLWPMNFQSCRIKWHSCTIMFAKCVWILYFIFFMYSIHKWNLCVLPATFVVQYDLLFIQKLSLSLLLWICRTDWLCIVNIQLAKIYWIWCAGIHKNGKIRRMSLHCDWLVGGYNRLSKTNEQTYYVQISKPKKEE